MGLTLPEGAKTKLARYIAGGLWAGALLGSAVIIWNAGRYEAVVPGVRERALLDSLIACAISAPVGWALWAGFILKG